MTEECSKACDKVRDIIHQAFKPVAEPQFNIGDKVIINKLNNKHNGKGGKIIWVGNIANGGNYNVQINNESTTLGCNEEEIKMELRGVKTCKLCKGSGRILMLNNYVPCDCVLSDTEI